MLQFLVQVRCAQQKRMKEMKKWKRLLGMQGFFYNSLLLLLFFFIFSDYICAHCTSRESPSWHHAGPNRQLMCDECRLYYNKYGEMRQFLKGISKESAKHHGVIVY